jgi:hypothetical protein
MRFTPYDDVMHANSLVSSVAINKLTGSSEVDGTGIDTALVFPAESIMVHVRAEIASGTPDAATVAWALQESNDNGSTDSWTAANDNTGTAIGGTLNVHTTAQDAYARIEGINLQNTSASAPKGGRKRWLRVALTPAFTNGTSPGILTYVELIGCPGNGQQLPVRTTVSNT